MQKFALIFGGFLSLCANAQAEIYHGIDIDKVYESSDWSSKEKVKELIDDYTLLLQYQKEFNNCPIELPKVLGCYDNMAEKIVKNLYVYLEDNIEQYKQLKKALSDAYGLKNCRNKYAWPAGHMCELDRMSDMSNELKKYIQDLLNFSKEQMFEYSSILKEYK